MTDLTLSDSAPLRKSSPPSPPSHPSMNLSFPMLRIRSGLAPFSIPHHHDRVYTVGVECDFRVPEPRFLRPPDYLLDRTEMPYAPLPVLVPEDPRDELDLGVPRLYVKEERVRVEYVPELGKMFPYEYVVVNYAVESDLYHEVGIFSDRPQAFRIERVPASERNPVREPETPGRPPAPGERGLAYVPQERPNSGARLTEHVVEIVGIPRGQVRDERPPARPLRQVPQYHVLLYLFDGPPRPARDLVEERLVELPADVELTARGVLVDVVHYHPRIETVPEAGPYAVRQLTDC